MTGWARPVGGSVAARQAAWQRLARAWIALHSGPFSLSLIFLIFILYFFCGVHSAASRIHGDRFLWAPVDFADRLIARTRSRQALLAFVFLSIFFTSVVDLTMITTVLFISLHAHTRTQMLCTQYLRESPEPAGASIGVTQFGDHVRGDNCLS